MLKHVLLRDGFVLPVLKQPRAKERKCMQSSSTRLTQGPPTQYRKT